MGSEWRGSLLEDAPLQILDGDRGKNYPKRTEFTKSGHCLFLNTGNVTQFGFDFSSNDFISKERDGLLRKGKLQREDIVLTTRGTVGNVAYFDGKVPFEHVRINSGMVIFRPDQKLLNARFLYLFLRSKLFKVQVDSLRTGSAQPQLPIRDIKKIEISLPDIDEQRAIAHILGSLDDKIELNRKMNETLEAMAQAMFKSWFVDFDPVIDNALAAGNPIPDELQSRAAIRESLGKARKPLPKDIGILFPSEFEFTEEIGWIPKGWEVGFLDDMVVLQRGFDLPKTSRTDGTYPLLAASGQDGTHNEAKVAGPGVVTGRSGKIGTVTFVQEDFWPLNTTLWVKEYKNSTPYHAYFLLNTLELERFNAGSAVPTLNRNHIHGMKLLVPPMLIVMEFTGIAGLMFDKRHANFEQTKSIAKLRVTLLPKLLSGELRIPEVEKIVEGAV